MSPPLRDAFAPGVLFRLSLKLTCDFSSLCERPGGGTLRSCSLRPLNGMRLSQHFPRGTRLTHLWEPAQLQPHKLAPEPGRGQAGATFGDLPDFRIECLGQNTLNANQLPRLPGLRAGLIREIAPLVNLGTLYPLLFVSGEGRKDILFWCTASSLAFSMSISSGKRRCIHGISGSEQVLAKPTPVQTVLFSVLGRGLPEDHLQPDNWLTDASLPSSPFRLRVGKIGSWKFKYQPFLTLIKYLSDSFILL